MDEATESYIMLLLADGNLPTGSFVASSGLESYLKHGFFGNTLSNSDTSSSAARTNQAIINFVEDNLGSYAHSALPFVSDAHIAIASYREQLGPGNSRDAHELILRRLTSLDDLYHSMTLNTVTRRASKAQGVALLTLFSKGLTKPQFIPSDSKSEMTSIQEDSILHLVADYKLRVRREDAEGHLPICWGILTAALGLSLERSQYLHLFLQARSLLSAAIRLNSLGPYAAQQILLHVVKDLVEKQMKTCQDLRSGLQPSDGGEDGEVINNLRCAATTWPLGEILAARHDLQHSRIFNS
ncbi:uncharacterized protein FOMMEDRAFT_133065 [Fomitiporia mediterranea MF3/22]|uniref:uncharacterized protein n=1 Tax=Fomitiporia mediterranea (strain MF3/22) TaxID=694068 RepID=UPI000440970A|nr:uncharacterized protein FOMMEDRAFT_133065 [Fomitiporia mediterranea MF3/22]EJD03663.1 hypothetical protein FOMMEDRAFT_133065 [Fomitiporia mediterranea MF3/22]